MANRSDIRRLDRLAKVRDTFSNVAEARVREAEVRVREIESVESEVGRNIRSTRADFADRKRLAAQGVVQNERRVKSLERQRVEVLQALDKAKVKLDQTRDQWLEARKDQKVVERLAERRLLELRRDEEIELQKTADDIFIGRLVRQRNRP